jgi:peptide chain release factor 1
MFKKLDEVEKKFERLSQDLQAPGVANDQKQYRSLMKEYAGLERVVELFREYKRVNQEIKDNVDILNAENDEDMRKLVKLDLTELEKRKVILEEEMKIALIPKDPNDDRNVIVEIRAGAGGDEASLFAEELFRAYSMYASTCGWKVSVVSLSPGNVGGYKEVIATISGDKEI